MRVTDAWGLPGPYLRAVSQVREPKAYEISVTELIKPAQQRALELRHWDELEVDARDRWELFLGVAVHEHLARFAGPDALAEERLWYEVDGWKIGGTPDHVEWLEAAGGVLTDWKTTRVRALQYDRPEWEAQVNLYAHLLALNGLPVTGVCVQALLKDWDKAQMAREPEYPRAPIVRLDMPLWAQARAHAYLRGRLAAHRRAARGYTDACTDDERWVRRSYAVTKIGAGRAAKVLPTRALAEAWLAAQVEWPRKGEDWYAVEERTGEPVRCQSYCAVARYCQQHREWLQAAEADPEDEAARDDALPPLRLVRGAALGADGGV